MSLLSLLVVIIAIVVTVILVLGLPKERPQNTRKWHAHDKAPIDAEKVTPKALKKEVEKAPGRESDRESF